MDPISLAAGAVPMVAGLLDKGMDLAKGAMDLANKVVNNMSDSGKVGADTTPRPETQVTF